MTKQRTFKTLVRQRMERTGERYATARMQLLRQQHDPLGASAGHRLATGGQQPDVAAARNLIVNAGVTGPGGGPLSEAMAFGLAGGIGFLYGVFSYAEGPTMTIVARNRSMPDPFLEPLFEAAGTSVSIETTGGAVTAAKRLDAHLAAGTPMLCTVAACGLPYLGLPDDEAGASPHVVGVVAADNDQVLVDDRAPVPLAVPRADFAAAQRRYRQARHRTITVVDVDEDHDWSVAVRSGLRRTVDGYDAPPVPQFASNVGLAGLEKWQRLLADSSDSKGWRTVFTGGPVAALGLTRLYDCVTSAYTSPGAGRPLFCDFLREADAVIDHAGIRAATESFEASGEHWARLAAIVVETHPDLAAYAEASDQRAALVDEGPAQEPMAALSERQRSLIAGATIPAGTAGAAYDALAEEVGRIVVLERDGLTELRAGL